MEETDKQTSPVIPSTALSLGSVPVFHHPENHLLNSPLQSSKGLSSLECLTFKNNLFLLVYVLLFFYKFLLLTKLLRFSNYLFLYLFVRRGPTVVLAGLELTR